MKEGADYQAVPCPCIALYYHSSRRFVYRVKLQGMKMKSSGIGLTDTAAEMIHSDFYHAHDLSYFLNMSQGKLHQENGDNSHWIGTQCFKTYCAISFE